MRKTIFTIVIFIIGATLCACGGGKKTAAAGDGEAYELYTCTADVLNIRAEPSATAEVIGVVLEGEVCAVVPDSTAGDFYKIMYGTTEAYASRNYFTIAPEGAVATEIGYKGDVEIDIYKASSRITLESTQSWADKLPRISAEDANYFRTDWIKKKMIPGENEPGSFFSPGITYYGNEQCKIESVLYVVPTHGSYEFLVTYDWRGYPVDCMQIGWIHVWWNTYAGSEIEGTTITYTSKWADETGSGTDIQIWEVTPQLKFVKVDEKNTVEHYEY